MAIRWQFWRDAVMQLREIEPAEADGEPVAPNYGEKFCEQDYARVPLRDLPFGVPVWLGDDAWGRGAILRCNNSVSRPAPADGHTLIWGAPRS